MARSYRDAYKITLPNGRVVWDYAGSYGISEQAKEAMKEHPDWTGSEEELILELVEKMEMDHLNPTISKLAKCLGGFSVEGLIPAVRSTVWKLRSKEKLWVVGTETFYAKQYEIFSVEKPKPKKVKK